MIAKAFRAGTPTLGICLGAQLLAIVAGGATCGAARPEIGWHEIRLTRAGATDPVVAALPCRFDAFEWHHDELLLPRDGVRLASSDACVRAFTLRDRPAWGLQLHPEATQDALGIWLDGWRADRDAAATGLDPAALRDETAAKIANSKELGRTIIGRFLTCAATKTPNYRTLEGRIA